MTTCCHHTLLVRLGRPAGQPGVCRVGPGPRRVAGQRAQQPAAHARQPQAGRQPLLELLFE